MRLTASLALLLPLTTGCDPAYFLRPKDWEPVNKHTWKGKKGPLYIEVGELGGLMYSRSADLRVNLRNSGSEPVEILGAELLSTTRTDSWAPKARLIVEPGQSKSVWFSWRMGQTLKEDYGTQATVRVRYRSGKKEMAWTIPFQE